jgi:hypothetical protein
MNTLSNSAPAPNIHSSPTILGRLFCLALLASLSGYIAFVGFTLLNPKPINNPEIISFCLTIFIFFITETVFFIGYNYLKKINKVSFNVILNNISKNRLIIFLLKLTSIIFLITLTLWLPPLICFNIYTYYLDLPPLENLGFGLILLLTTIIVPTLSLALFLLQDIFMDDYQQPSVSYN